MADFNLLQPHVLSMCIYSMIEPTCLWDSSRCFMRTATTTLTRTNWAIRTNTTKNMAAARKLTQQLLKDTNIILLTLFYLIFQKQGF